MAERVSFIPEKDEETEDDFSPDSPSSKKKSKKSAEKIGAALIDRTEVTKADNSLEKLRGLFAEKPEKATEKAKAETTIQEISDRALETAPLAEWRELSTDELSGGEVVIELHGEDTGNEENPEEIDDAAPPSVEQANGSGSPEDVETEDDEASLPPAAGGGGAGSGSSRGSSASTSGHGSSGGSGGGVPPRPPVVAASYPPTPRRRTTSTTSHVYPSVPSQPNAANFNQLLAVQQAADEAWSQGRGRGRGEGLLAGLLVGGGIEHLRHKSREKKMEKKAKTDKLKQEKSFEADRENLTRKATKDRLEYEQKLHAEADAAIISRTSEAAATAKALAAEKARADAEKEKANLIERLNAQAAEQERLEAEALLKDPEHRIETSAWHAMEVDKSGHVVEDSSIEYGHEYYSERAHEAGPKDQLDAKAGSTAIAAALLATSTASKGAQQEYRSDISSSSPQSTRQSVLPPIPGIDDRDDQHGSSHVSVAALLPWLIVLVIVAVAIIALT